MRKPKKNKKPADARIVTCVHCSTRHYAVEGGWVVNGLDEVLCYNQRRNCFDEMRYMRASASNQAVLENIPHKDEE